MLDQLILDNCGNVYNQIGVEGSSSFNYSIPDNLPLFEEGYTGRYWEPGCLPLLNRKVFLGMRVSVREHPYIASVRRMVAHVCVASVLSKNVLVTVAHPVIDVPLDELTVVAGENYADRGASLMNVVLVVVHEHFNPYTLHADLALLRVYPDLLIRVSVKPIPVFRVGYSLEGLTAFVSGWGRCDLTGRELCLSRSSVYTPGENLDPMLRTVRFPINMYGNHCRVYEINNAKTPSGTLCLGPAREVDPLAPCLAAPGAALVAAGHLLGIQSFGYGCGYEFDLPLIYTDMRHHFRWLISNKSILTHLRQEKFITLFNVTRGYILIKWIQMTRQQKVSPLTYTSRRMKVWHIDKKLAMLEGTVIDIRDYIYGGNYKLAKRNMYRKLKKKIEDRRKIYEIRHNITVGYNKSNTAGSFESFLHKKYSTTIEDKLSLNQPNDDSPTYEEGVHYINE